MKQLFLIGLITLFVTGCQTADLASNVPKDQQAEIDGLSETEILLSPVVKLNWPGLISFDIYMVDDHKVGAFSDAKAIVGPGRHTIEVTASGQWQDDADLMLTFEAKPGHEYLLRPVFNGRRIEAAIQDKRTKEIVARSW